jgi:hypothetical protein
MADTDTPWWSNLIAVLVTAVVSVMGTAYFLTRPPGPIGVPTLGSFFTDTITYIPHILLLFGVLADMFTGRGVYSIGSLVGLLSIPLNYVMAYFWTGLYEVFGRLSEIAMYGPKSSFPPKPNRPGVVTGGAIEKYDGCEVQGFKWLGSKYAPQTLVVTATVFSYYIFDLIANRGMNSATLPIVAFAILFIGEMTVIGPCSTGEGGEPSRFLKGLIAFAEGALFGGSSYGIVQAYFPEKLPSTALPAYEAPDPKDLKPGPDGSMVDSSGRSWREIAPGVYAPDTCSAAGRAALSTGTSSTGDKCDTSGV